MNSRLTVWGVHGWRCVGPPILRQFLFTLDIANRRPQLVRPADGQLAATVEPTRK